MDPDIPSFMIADVVETVAGRDAGQLFYVVAVDGQFLSLANGRDRTLEKSKRKKCKHAKKVLRSETRVAEKLRNGDKVLNSELRRDLAHICQTMQSNNPGG